MPLHHHPWSLLQTLQEDLGTNLSVAAGSQRAWYPEADISHFQDRYEIALDLPGVTADQVEITLESGLLKIRGERAGIPSSDLESEQAPQTGCVKSVAREPSSAIFASPKMLTAPRSRPSSAMAC